jgi:muconolactone delta-isomerase
MQFMASISFDAARHVEVEQLLAAEQARVRELQQQGILDTVYVPDGSGAPAGLWVVFNGDSRDAVQRVI